MSVIKRREQQESLRGKKELEAAKRREHDRFVLYFKCVPEQVLLLRSQIVSAMFSYRVATDLQLDKTRKVKQISLFLWKC